MSWPAERRRGLARSLGLGLLAAAPAVLVVGNHITQNVAGRTSNPFGVFGPAFLLGLLPLFIVLAVRGAWMGGLALVVAFQAALAVMTYRGVAPWVAGGIVAVNVGVAVLILLADREENRGVDARPGGPGPAAS